MKISQNIEDLLKQEFLITNGIGGYASSSIAFANTRKYHGLLVASYNPPTERKVVVHKVEERIKVGGEFNDLTTNKFGGGGIHPHGYQYLKNFSRQPIATWSYESDQWSLTKEVMMVKDSNTTIINYTNNGDTPIEIEVHPLFTYKDYHSVLRENDYDFYYVDIDNGIKIHPFPDCPPIFFKYSTGKFTEDRAWYRDFHYDRSQYRGLEHLEDSYRMGLITTVIKPGKSFQITLSTEEKKLNAKATSVKKQLTTLYDEKASIASGDAYLQDLLISGDQFIVNRASTKSKTILAGYHWFTDWGRDTMIAMRGLTISTGRKKDSESILKTFFKYLDSGMLPNRFPDNNGEEVEYNTIDATLWLFIVIHEYYEQFGDKTFVKRYLKDLETIIDYHTKGTRYNIHVNNKGFIQGGEYGYQLTWMDAKVNNHVVTPRIGSPVEINVLWYNALMIFKTLSAEVDYQPSIEVEDYIKLLKKNFKSTFLNKDGYLNDFIDNNGNANADFRCNQIYAVSLPYSLLNKKEEKTLVNQVNQKLVTGLGLRTLDEGNPAFRPDYAGDQWNRDTAYHQGTVWPFFIGEYYEAYLKVNGYSSKAKKIVRNQLLDLKNHFYNSDCIHGISEVFDGKNPTDGRGCINQAWSVATLIKLYMNHPELI
jgi:predicted glycogen debranching enzyme